jgi:hypothetical protein
MHDAICFGGGFVTGGGIMWALAKAIVIQYRERIVEGEREMQKAQLALNNLRRNIDLAVE